MILLAIAAIGQAPVPAGEGARCAPEQGRIHAATYAPVIRFAPDERYFPTLPFFAALDGVNQSGPLRKDLDDLDEIAPLSDDGRRMSWDRLDEWYAASPEPLHAVSYHFECLDDDERRRFWRFLRGDPQAWRRFGLAEVYDRFRRSGADLGVVEYYMYYMNDEGLQGHRQDIEFVFVFFPVGEGSPDFRVTVGAGHDSRTPNNVHFGRGDEPIGVLVEFGGHGSAPDAGTPGAFNPYVDVNVHSADAWGTRDQLAIGGDGYVGRYRPEYTIPRGVGVSAHLTPPRREVEPGSQPIPARGPTGYALIPVDLLRRLQAAIDTGNGTEVGRILRALGRAHRVPLPEDWTPDGATLDRLRVWGRPMCCDHGDEIPVKRHQVWRHEIFEGRSTVILKNHLYRPSWEQVQTQKILILDALTVSGFVGTGGTAGAAVGLVLPFPSAFSLRLPFVMGLEVGGARERHVDSGSGWYGALVVDGSYRERFSWYSALRYYSRRRHVTRVDSAGLAEEGTTPSYEVALGVSWLALVKSDARHVDPFRRIRVRTGFSLPLRYVARPAPSFELQVVLH